MKKRLSFARKIDGVFGFAKINPFHPITIIEKKCLALSVIYQKTAKQAIQSFKELIAFFFVEMDQPITFILFDFMSLLPQTSASFGIDKAFSREEKRDLFVFIEERLIRSERVFVCHPTPIYSHFRDGVCA